MSNLKQAQAFTQEAVKIEKVNRLTQIKNYELAMEVPTGEDLVDHFSAKFIRTGGCGNPVKHLTLESNFWTVESLKDLHQSVITKATQFRSFLCFIEA